MSAAARGAWAGETQPCVRNLQPRRSRCARRATPVWPPAAESQWSDTQRVGDLSASTRPERRRRNTAGTADVWGRTNRVKIVHALGWYYPESLGGTEVYVAALCRRLRAAGHAVAVVAPDTTG